MHIKCAHSLENLKSMSDLEVDVFHKFLDIYDNNNVIIADRVYKTHSTLDVGEGIILQSTGNYDMNYCFKRTIRHNGDDYIVGVNYIDESYDFILNPKVRKIKEIFVEHKGNENFYDIENVRADCLNDKKLSLVLRVNAIFEGAKLLSPGSVYFNKLDINKLDIDEALGGFSFLKKNSLEKLLNEEDSENKLFLTARKVGGVQNSSMVEFATILVQLLNYRNKFAGCKSESFMKKLDKYIIKLADREMVKLVMKQSFIDFTGSRRVSEVELFSATNGGLDEEVKTLNKIV